MRPMLSYYGAKWRTAKRYPRPIHQRIVEPFAGSAGYSVRYPSRDVVLVDRDPRVIAAWRFLIETESADILGLPLLGPDDTLDDFDLSDGARALIGFWLRPGSTGGGKRLTAWARHNPDGANYWSRRRRSILASQSSAIRHWTAILGHYTDAEGFGPATWFIDPPYQGPPGRHYPHGDIDFPVLGMWCRDRRGQVIVCEHMGANWLPFRPLHTSRYTSGGSPTRQYTEGVWIKKQPVNSTV